MFKFLLSYTSVTGEQCDNSVKGMRNVSRESVTQTIGGDWKGNEINIASKDKKGLPLPQANVGKQTASIWKNSHLNFKMLLTYKWIQ